LGLAKVGIGRLKEVIHAATRAFVGLNDTRRARPGLRPSGYGGQARRAAAMRTVVKCPPAPRREARDSVCYTCLWHKVG
jgi:hypothetical protein